MKYKDKLIKYVKFKNENIKSLVGLDYVTQDDIAELQEWSNKTCRDVFTNIDPRNEMESCPWCVLHKILIPENNCTKCGYGKRHNICNNEKGSSRYGDIKSKAKELGIDNILASKEIKEIYNGIRIMNVNTFYIQRKGNGYLETVDEINTLSFAKVTLKEYLTADPTADYYISTRACKNWKSKQTNII